MVEDESLICEKVHKSLNSLKRHRFPFNQSEIPDNGLYILFEDGEKAHGEDRIVRIGTHTGKNQLPSRISQHFLMQNKDRSIFRKNIGRAILNKNNDPFLKDWEIDLTTKKAREENLIDSKKLEEIENQVSEYIQENFSFAVIPMDDLDKRLKLESKLISTVSLCPACKPSENWLGNFSPKEKIRKSRLWLVNELWKNPLTETEFMDLVKTNFS